MSESLYSSCFRPGYEVEPNGERTEESHDVSRL